MTAGNWIAVAALLAMLLIPIVTALIAHIRRDEQRETRLMQVEREIGTRETGMRGSIHDHGNAITWLGGCLWFVANKLGIELPRRDK